MEQLANNRATWREWAGLATLALPTLMIGVDMTVLHLAVPRLSADLQPSSTQLLWIVDIYGFLIAGFLLTMGTLGDRIGRRRLLMIGAFAFAFASIFAALSTSPEMLIFARALLGIAGATLMPSTLSLIRNMFHHSGQRTFAISIWMMCILTGQALGPLTGGILLEFFWWGSVFLIGVPVMAMMLALAPFFLPEYRDPKPGRLDLTSSAMSLLTILAVVFALKHIARYGPDAEVFVALAIGSGIGYLFIRRQRTLPSPMLDLELFRSRAFGVIVATHSLSMFLLAGVQFLTAQHLQLVLGLAPVQAGMWMVPAAIGGMIGALLAAAFLKFMRPVNAIVSNLLIGVFGFALLTQVDVSSGLTLLVTGLVLATFAVSLVTALTTDLIIAAVPGERAGTASGISETSAEFGIAMGIAMLGSIGTAVYRFRLSDSMPSEVGDRVSESSIDTLGAAVATANELPDELGAPLVHAARDAFAMGLSVTAIIGALAMAALALICYRSLQPHQEREREPGTPVTRPVLDD